MLRLPQFQYLKPSSVDEACCLLKKHEGAVKLLAGGTDLLPSMKQRLFTPEHVLDLRQVAGLRGIANGGGKALRIGSLTTLSTGRFNVDFALRGCSCHPTAALAKKPHLNEHECKRAISGNLCRCTGYVKIIEAIKAVAK